MKKKEIKKNTFTHYSTTEFPTPDGKSTRHRPRRNYWGNLIEDDTYSENDYSSSNYDYSDLDNEDDHDSFYNDDNYK